MDIIKELWYGNVAPFEPSTRGDKQLKELLMLTVRNKEELDGTLTEKQKEILKKFEENINAMHGIAERDAFSYDFRLGVQLMAEAFLRPLPIASRGSFIAFTTISGRTVTVSKRCFTTTICSIRHSNMPSVKRSLRSTLWTA